MTDSTQLRTGRYVPDNSLRSKKKKRKETKKLHIAGESTGPEKIIYSVELTKSDRGDSPLFIPLLEKIEGRIGNTTADKGYCSRLNAQYVEDRGGTPWITIKKNVKPRSKGYPAFKHMVNRFEENPFKYRKVRNKRSNGEAINSSYKRRIGRNLFSRNDKAKENETVLKAICYNLRHIPKRLARLNRL